MASNEGLAKAALPRMIVRMSRGGPARPGAADPGACRSGSTRLGLVRTTKRCKRVFANWYL